MKLKLPSPHPKTETPTVAQPTPPIPKSPSVAVQVPTNQPAPPRLKLSLLKILFLVNLISIVLFLLPFPLINSLTTQIEQIRAQTLASRINLTTTAKVKNDLGINQSQANLVLNALPNEANIIDFIKLMDGLNSLVQIKTFTLEANEPIAQAGYFYLPLALKLTGSLDDLFAALNSLARSPYFFEFTQIRFTASESLFKQATLETNFKLYVSADFNQN